MPNPFEVTGVDLSGFGQIAQAFGKRREDQQAEEKATQEKGAAQQVHREAFKLLNQSSQSQDPAERERLFMEAYQMAPGMIKGFIDTTKKQQEDVGEKPMTDYQRSTLEIQEAKLKLAREEEERKVKQGAIKTAEEKNFAKYQELKKTDPEGAKLFGQMSGIVTKEGRELSAHMQKRLSAATDAAVESRNNVVKFNTLAENLDKKDIGGGLLQGKWGEAYKDITGNQDAVTDLRRRFLGIRASQVVRNLPPGSASDADIALAISGFPTENASGKQMASFLRGLAKLEVISGDFEEFKASFISQKGSERDMLKAWREKLDSNVAQTVEWEDLK